MAAREDPLDAIYRDIEGLYATMRTAIATIATCGLRLFTRTDAAARCEVMAADVRRAATALHQACVRYYDECIELRREIPSGVRVARAAADTVLQQQGKDG